MVPLNFTSHPNFSLFSSGGGIRNLTYYIPYNPLNNSKFWNNVSASLSFNRVNASFPDYFVLLTYIHQINSSSVILSIQTDMSCVYFDLQGTLVLFGNDTASKF
jgi:hypothetical protein